MIRSLTSRAVLLPVLLAIAQAASVQADLRGIYIYTNDVSQISNATASQLTQSFNVPGVDGVAIVIGWDAIEPSMGQYQWATLDQWIGQVAALGKKIDLVVPAGSSTPTWLFQPPPAGAGATELNFTVSPHAGETGVCDTVNIAAPWDPSFLAQWDSLIAALSAHLKSAGTYNAITLVRLTGINRTTEELRLPAETAASTGLACVSNSTATWQQAGYRPSLLLQGWNAILGSFRKSFPDKPFAVSIIPNDAFPGIAEDGSAITGHIGDENQPLLTTASQQLPGRLVVQFDFLMPGEAASTEVTNAAQDLGTMAAFQTNEYLGNQGSGCSEPVTSTIPCTAATFLTMLDTGIYPLGASNSLTSQYIEVFHANALAFPADILAAHLQLLPPSISLVANAEGESPTIAPNSWVEIKGAGLSLTGDSRIWKSPDFQNNQLPTQLDNISATVNGKPAFVYYISPTQINVLTAPDSMSGPVQVEVTDNGTTTASFTAQAQSLSPSFFVFNGGPYVAATHANGAYLGPTMLYPGATTPAKPGEVVVLYGNGFGPTSTPVTGGSITQSGTLSPLPVIKIGGVAAGVQFAGLVEPGQYQFNVAVPSNLADGDQPIIATYGGQATQSGSLITIHQ
ncbi:MAG: beta-galactosidase [Candidatus Sulfopaludibacter sp.]|nr:beta-galactosidase [Candidatus Sulfopaludibacter sp.]